MEDAATAEISRAQVWQWMHHRATLAWSDGATAAVDASTLGRIVDEEMAVIAREVGDARMEGGKFDAARALFVRLATAPRFEEFLTLSAYDQITTLAHP